MVLVLEGSSEQSSSLFLVKISLLDFVLDFARFLAQSAILSFFIIHCSFFISPRPQKRGEAIRGQGLYSCCMCSQAGEQGRDDGYDELTDGLDGSFCAFFHVCVFLKTHPLTDLTCGLRLQAIRR